MRTLRQAEAEARLWLFGIPGGSGADVARVRKMLARMVLSDSLAMAEMQIARDIVRRLDAVPAEAYLFLAAMFLSLHGGNTFFRPERGPALIDAAGYDDRPDDESYGRMEFLADIKDVWPIAVASAESLAGDIVQRRAGADGERWYFKINAAAIDAVSRGLSSMAAEASDARPLSGDELEDAISFEKFNLNPEQVAAVKSAAERMFTVVTGGPGTGKTTIVCAILRALMRRGLGPEDVALAAPTARAAQRMSESLAKQCDAAKHLDAAVRAGIESLNGSTIHSLLGGYPPNWRYNAENKLPLKLVIVDESSMVDVMLMKALVDAIPPDCRLVLLGDKDQLPSVDAGAVLGDITGGSAGESVVRLKTSNRFTGALAECAAAIRDGNAAQFCSKAMRFACAGKEWAAALASKETENNCFIMPLPDGGGASALHVTVCRWADFYGLLGEGELVKLASDAGLQDDESLSCGVNTPKTKAIFDALDRSRILTVLRSGPFGAGGMNDLLVAKRFCGRKPANPLSRPGIPVLVTRNTPARNLMNGDIGVTVEGRAGMVAIFPRGRMIVSCPVGLLPEYDLAYAITIHKSQGSEFSNVLTVLPDDVENPLLGRQLLYTGVTRAKKRAVIIGTRAALDAAIERKQERDCGIEISSPEKTTTERKMQK